MDRWMATWRIAIGDGIDGWMNCGGYVMDVSYREVMYRVVYRVEHGLLVDTHNDTSPEHEFDEYHDATCVTTPL